MASNPFFTKSAQPMGSAKGSIVRGATLRIVRAVPGSQGKDLRSDPIDYTDQFRSAEDWVDINIDDVRPGPSSGFGKWEKVNDDLEDLGRLPVESFMGPLSTVEEQALQAESRGPGLMSGLDPTSGQDLRSVARVHRDPVTRIPENIAEQDPRAESDAFYGSDKYPRQLENVMKRYDEVDRGREQVDYGKSKSIPIKVIRRP